MTTGELDMSRKVVGMDGSEWFLKIRVSCLSCKKRGEVCYWALESKRLDGACHRCKGMKLACRVEEELQSEVLSKKAQMTKGKGKARAMPVIAEDSIPVKSGAVYNKVNQFTSMLRICLEPNGEMTHLLDL